MNQSPISSPSSLSRRDALRAFGASALAVGAAFLAPRSRAADAVPAPAAGGTSAPPAPSGPFKLPPLGFEYNALEPAINQLTMELHHKRHHQAYINNANLALQNNPELHGKSAEELLGAMNSVPGSIRLAVRNNVGGHANHTLFWDILAPGGAKTPGGSLARKLTSDLKSFEDMIRELSAAALGRFGSGWAWLSVYNKKLIVQSTANQDSPLMDGATPILGLDVWEHAYYLNYQNRRGDYVSNLLGLINWDRVGKRFEAAMG
jgi:Fe-Mn family superoxide dismutase